MTDDNQNIPLGVKTQSITISDLRDFYFDDLSLDSEQVLALSLFDKYRLQELKSIDDDQKFQKKYLDLLVLENTIDYRELLKKLKI